MGGLRSSGSLFSAWDPPVGLIEFGSIRRATTEGLSKVASILPPFPGKLTPSKPLFSGAGAIDSKKLQPATGHREHSDGASRKRREGDGSPGVSCGEDRCDAVSLLLLQVQALVTLHWNMCAPPLTLIYYQALKKPPFSFIPHSSGMGLLI